MKCIMKYLFKQDDLVSFNFNDLVLFSVLTAAFSHGSFIYI